MNDFAFDDQNLQAEINYQSKKTQYEARFLEFEGFTGVYAYPSKAQ